MTPDQQTAFRTYLESLQGAPYVWWREGTPVFSLGPPFYATNPSPPPAEDVLRCGTNCAGLANLARLAVGLPPLGGTPHWQEALLPHWKVFDPIAPYPAFSLVYRPYVSEEDQGHIAILWSEGGPAWNQKLLHSYAEKGVALDEKLGTSHSWTPSGYYKFVCLPQHWLGAAQTYR